jgi:HNH endonuclease
MDEIEEAEEAAIEGAAWVAVQALARAIVAVAGPVWRFGDGQGGAVIQEIYAAAAEGGLEIRDGAWWPPTRVQLLAARDGWDCHYCHTPLAGGPGVPIPVVDHVLAQARGGGNELANLVLACGPCNGAKGALPVDAFLARLASRP